MQHKKFKLVIILLLTVSLGAVYATTMYVKGKTGVSNSFDISQMRCMAFSSGSLVVINKSGDTMSFMLNEIQAIEYSFLTAIESEKPTKTGMTLIPSLVNDVCTLSYPSQDNAEVTIISISGKTVYAGNIGGGTTTLNLSALPKGIYLCRLLSGKTIVTQKFIKQ